MDILWQCRQATVREVVVTLQQERRLAYTTVMTVMNRLVDKGVLVREKQGRAFLYWPAHDRAGLAEATARRIVRALVADFGDVALTQFVEELRSVDPARLAALRRLAEGEAAADES